MENKKMVKEDINFLEYPNWVIDKKNKDIIWKIEKQNGTYEMISPLGLPKHFDKIILYFLLYKLYREKKLESYELITNRYEIAKNVFPGLKSFGKNKYDRIIKALKKWGALTINFEGLFYGDDLHTLRCFSIIDEFVLEKKSGKLCIKFSTLYVQQLKNSKFYKYIDFEQYKKLHKTSSARLYEILSKSFKDRKAWSIGIQLLAEKLTFEKRKGANNYYPSDVLRYLKPSINEINKKTDLSINFQYDEETNVCSFKEMPKQEVPKQKEKYIPATRDAKQTARKSMINARQKKACLKKFNALSIEEKNAILHGIANEPFLKFIKDQEMQIYAYMSRHENQ